MADLQLRIQLPDVVLRAGTILLVSIGLVCCALFLWFEFEARYFQAEFSHVFDEQRKPARSRRDASRTTNEDPSVKQKSFLPKTPEATRDLVGRLEIPRIGVEVMVLQGADPSTLRRGAGWLPETARPGDGNAAIAAHRDTYFRPLRHIKEGDVIYLTTYGARFTFLVEWTAVVSPDDTVALGPTNEPALTLITCYPFYYVGNAPNRFVVRAVRQQQLRGFAQEVRRQRVSN